MGFFVWLQQIMGQAQGKKGPIQLQGMAQQEWTQILHCSRDSCWGSRSAHPCWSSETPGKNIPEISCATKASTSHWGGGCCTLAPPQNKDPQGFLHIFWALGVLNTNQLSNARGIFNTLCKTALKIPSFEHEVAGWPQDGEQPRQLKCQK